MPTDDFSRRDIEFHRATAATYDQDTTAVFGVYHRYLVEPYLDWLASEIQDGRALDLGCGTGVISLGLAKRGFSVLGIDHSEEMLAVANEKLSVTELSGSVEFVQGDVQDVPARDGDFDCITCQGLLHHLPELEPCLRELSRVLRPGGYFFISEPSSSQTPLSRLLELVGRLLRFGRRPQLPDGLESVEAPIAPDNLITLLDVLKLEYEVRFLIHLGPLRRVLPESAYLLVVRALSFPWRTTRGDLMFVFGRKPGQESPVLPSAGDRQVRSQAKDAAPSRTRSGYLRQ